MMVNQFNSDAKSFIYSKYLHRRHGLDRMPINLQYYSMCSKYALGLHIIYHHNFSSVWKVVKWLTVVW